MSILISIAFFTLMERKVLSFSQNRIGPNKIFLIGIVQPVLDGLKLFKKMSSVNMKIHFLIFKIISTLMLMCTILMWMIMPFLLWANKMLVMFWFLSVLGFISFLILLLGWSSLSKLGFLGGNRSLAQSLSFEVSLSLLIFIPFLLKEKFSLKFNEDFSFFNTSILMLLFFIMILLETQRSPMDLAEGESELVSGFNTEFSSIVFVLIFLAEYSSLLLMSNFIWVFLSSFSFLKSFLTLMLLLLVRSCFPRIRYDVLMNLMWLKLLPILILLWFFFYLFKIM